MKSYELKVDAFGLGELLIDGVKQEGVTKVVILSRAGKLTKIRVDYLPGELIAQLKAK